MEFRVNDTVLYCDIDGVVADTTTACKMAIWDRYKVIIDPEDIDRFDLPEATYQKVDKISRHPPKTQEEYADYLTKSCFWNPSFYHGLLPLQPMWSGIRKWIWQSRNMSFNEDFPASMITFITTRHYSMYDETMRWLQRYGFIDRTNTVSLIIQSHKHLVLKQIATANPDMKVLFIDDKLETMINVLDLGISNVYCRMPNRPWNSESHSNRDKWTSVIESLKDRSIDLFRCVDDKEILREMGI